MVIIAIITAVRGEEKSSRRPMFNFLFKVPSNLKFFNSKIRVIEVVKERERSFKSIRK